MNKIGLIESLILSNNTLSMINMIRTQTELQITVCKKLNEIGETINGLERRKRYHCFSDFGATEQEYQNDKENLIKNLDISAIEKVKILIDRLEKSAFPDKNKDIFSLGDERQIKRCWRYMGRREKKDNYYTLDNNFKLPIDHFESSVFYYKHGLDTLKTLNKIGNKSIIDVGCFIADSCLIFRQYTNNKIYAFEPSKRNYNLSLETIKLNNLNDVFIENIGLSDKINEFCLSDRGSGSSINEKYGEQIKCDKLDNYVKKNNIKVGLIKVDIEGHEQFFLKGAENTIREQKPILLLSIYHNYSDFFHIKPLIESWNLGYKFDFFKGEDGGSFNETLLICEIL